MEADFEDDSDDRPMIEGRAERDPPPPANVASLPAPNLCDKLAQFENLGDDQRERVPAGNDRGEAQQQQRRQDPPQQGQGQSQGQQGQAKPQQQRQADLPHQNGQGASQGQPQQQATGTDVALLTDEQRAQAAANERAAEIIGFIHNSNDKQLDEAFGAPPHIKGNAALLRRLDQLAAAFPPLHQQINTVLAERRRLLGQQREAA
jgi:hypothetical protein